MSRTNAWRGEGGVPPSALVVAGGLWVAIGLYLFTKNAHIKTPEVEGLLFDIPSIDLNVGLWMTCIGLALVGAGIVRSPQRQGATT